MTATNQNLEAIYKEINVIKVTYKCHICLKMTRIERRICVKTYQYTYLQTNPGRVMSQKKLVKQLFKKLDKLESDREKLIDKLAKALDKLEKKVATKKTPAKKSPPAKKVPVKKAVAKKSAAKKAPAKKAAAKKAPANKPENTSESN